MRAANYSAFHHEFALNSWRECDGRRMPRLHWLFDTHIGNVKSVLYVSRSHIQRDGLSVLYMDHRGLNAVLTHDYIDVLGGTFALVASCCEEKET